MPGTLRNEEVIHVLLARCSGRRPDTSRVGHDYLKFEEILAIRDAIPGTAISQHYVVYVLIEGSHDLRPGQFLGAQHSALSHAVVSSVRPYRR